jgi:hypothetical protein
MSIETNQATALTDVAVDCRERQKHEELSQRQDWRDKRLAALVAHKSRLEN